MLGRGQGLHGIIDERPERPAIDALKIDLFARRDCLFSLGSAHLSEPVHKLLQLICRSAHLRFFQKIAGAPPRSTPFLGLALAAHEGDGRRFLKAPPLSAHRGSITTRMRPKPNPVQRLPKQHWPRRRSLPLKADMLRFAIDICKAPKLTSAYGVLPPFLSAGTLLDFEAHPALLLGQVFDLHRRPALPVHVEQKPLQAWGARFGGRSLVLPSCQFN
jgi:hypothetical protein